MAGVEHFLALEQSQSWKELQIFCENLEHDLTLLKIKFDQNSPGSFGFATYLCEGRLKLEIFIDLNCPTGEFLKIQRAFMMDTWEGCYLQRVRPQLADAYETLMENERAWNA